METIDKRMRLAFASSLGGDAAREQQRMARLHKEEQIRAAVRLGDMVGHALAQFSPEEISAFRLGLLAAEASPHTH